MSEYQYIEFRAVDRPLTDNELAYAGKQSSRAEFSRWSFTNEYHYSDFRGNVDGMLRHGYDVFLHYANYGIRTIKIRLPHGLPFAKKIWSRYINGNSLKWKPDPKGKGGILVLDPFYDALDGYWDFDDCLSDVIAAREKLMAGDLRALYFLWLCAAGDENCDPSETIEPPVPCGLHAFDLGRHGLFSFYDLDPLIVDAAASGEGNQQQQPLIPVVLSPAQRIAPWLKTLNVKQAKDYLKQLLVGDTMAIKAETLAEIAEQNQLTLKLPAWPTVNLSRTYEDLLRVADGLREDYDAKEEKKQKAKAKRAAAKKQKEREKRLAAMVKDPQKWIAETDRLVGERGTASYKQAAEILADLKEAIGGAKGAQIAHQHAAHLANKYPRLNHLKSSLRKSGVWD